MYRSGPGEMCRSLASGLIGKVFGNAQARDTRSPSQFGPVATALARASDRRHYGATSGVDGKLPVVWKWGPLPGFLCGVLLTSCAGAASIAMPNPDPGGQRIAAITHDPLLSVLPDGAAETAHF